MTRSRARVIPIPDAFPDTEKARDRRRDRKKTTSNVRARII